MSSPISNSSQVGFDPTALLGQVELIREQASTSISQALTTMGVVNTGTSVDPTTGKTKLQPPSSLMMDAGDLTLKIGLLQEALQNLETQVTQLQITNRMNQQNMEAKEQLQRIQQQVKDAVAAGQKQEEANKKSGIFGAIAHFFSAVFDFVSAIVNIVEAIPLAIGGDEVGAGALLASSACLIGAGVCETVLGIDSAVQAATGQGFLSDSAKQGLETASTVLMAVAGAAAIISGIGAITVGIRDALGAATEAIAKEGVDAGAQSAVKATMQGVMRALSDIFKPLAEDAVDLREALGPAAQAAREAFDNTCKETLQALVKNAKEIGMIAGLGTGAKQILEGTGTLVTNRVLAEAAQMQEQADMDKAEAKAIEAAVQKLQKQIQQLENMLQQLVQSMSQSVTSVLNTATSSTASVGKMLQNFGV